MWFKLFKILSVGLVSTVTMAACISTTNEAVVVEPTPSPTPTPTPLPEPNSDHLQLDYPETVLPEESFGLSVINVGPHPYEVVFADGDNCLGVQGKQDPYRITPGLTCDVLNAAVIHPGQSLFVGSWDLHMCADEDCLTRESAPPGTYFTKVTARLYDGSDTYHPEWEVQKQAEFVIADSPEAGVINPISSAGNLAWVIPSDVTTRHHFSATLAPGTSQRIAVHMNDFVTDSANSGSRQVTFKLACEGSDVNQLEWFFEQVGSYPAAAGFQACGDVQAVEFNQRQNSQLINLWLSPDSMDSVSYMFTAVIEGK